MKVIKMRLVFLLYSCIFSLHVFSLPIIEVAQLAESNLATLYNLDAKNESKNATIQYDTVMINQLKSQLPMVNNLIKSKLLKSELFVVMDADSTIKLWQIESPNVLSTLYSASAMSESQALLQKKAKLLLEPRYVLLGWITSIDSWEKKEKIFNSDKVSFLNSLDIWVKYKIVDSYNRQVISEFISLGHYGLARILPNLNKNVNFVAEPIIEGAISNLADDLLRAISDEFPSSSLQNKSKIKLVK